MSDVISLIQAVVRDQLRSFRTAELGVVTAAYPHESEGDRNNYGCDIRLRDSGLELKQVPVSTGRVGLAAIPNEDDLVLVQYLHGDIHSAIVTGRLYSDQDRPPVAKAQELVYVCPDDPASGVRRLFLELPHGNKLTLNDDLLTLEMGQTTIKVNNDGDIELSSNANLTIDSKGDATIKTDGSLELKATGDVSIEGMNVSIKGQSNTSLEGTGGATLKGATVSIAGQTDFSAA